ncbi:hypothetical protein [Euzebya tangerina]|uniref:hypothetical protein n=1 Tax=Euzebya tangerina TaxID=591198 RepID=UPI002F3202D8
MTLDPLGHNDLTDSASTVGGRHDLRWPEDGHVQAGLEVQLPVQRRRRPSSVADSYTVAVDPPAPHLAPGAAVDLAFEDQVWPRLEDL